MATGVSLAQARLSLNWAAAKANTGFDDSEISSSMYVSPAWTVDSSNLNQVYAVQSTLAVGANVTINLNSLTEPFFGQSITPVRFYMGLFWFTGATWKYEPGATNGWNGQLQGTAPYLADAANSGFALFSTTALTIDNGVKNIKISNTGLATLTYKLTLFLGS